MMQLLLQISRRLITLAWYFFSWNFELVTGVSTTWGGRGGRRKWTERGLGSGRVLRQRVLFVARGGGDVAHLFGQHAHVVLFNGYDDTDCLLNDDVTLMAVNEERVLFARTPKEIDVYDSKKSGAFIYA